MFRSKAPSQILKNRDKENNPNNLSPDFIRSCTLKIKKFENENNESNLEIKVQKPVFNSPFQTPLNNFQRNGSSKTLGIRKASANPSMFDPNDENALILFSPPFLTEHEKILTRLPKLVHVVVDPSLTCQLRPHQREGVKFMYDCLTGAKIENCYGCIMADDMGLGKTLQSITVMYTLMKQSPRGGAEFTKSLIVCPASLVKNWEKEVYKWVGNRLNVLTVEGGGKDMISYKIQKFSIAPINQPYVLIISYESFRINVENLLSVKIGLVICDEGHRLKNQDNQIYQALTSIDIQRRILISGTPIQNDLLEYFSLIHFVNEGILGSRSDFKRNFENPILRGRDALATESEQNIGNVKLKELLQIVSRCIIRRTASILSKYLPIKTENVICIQMTDIQKTLYQELVQSKTIKNISENETGSKGLELILLFKKLCNHPILVVEKDKTKKDGLTGIYSIINKLYSCKEFDPTHSGKFRFIDHLLHSIKANTNDKIVIVSNYTQTLDLIENLCNLRNFQFLRLDGSMSIKKRQKMVDIFNIPESPEFVFMLSSKAGGCGLNLIGANRLVMFDPDWNPANDAQAMARVWRDGQRKLVYIYRLVCTGTIEEKILQRQVHKKALSSCVVDELVDVERHFSKNDLRDLFSLSLESRSTTHDQIKCKRCSVLCEVTLPPEDATCCSDFSLWRHSWTPKGVEDSLLRHEIWKYADITFIFNQKSHTKQLGLV